MDMQKKVSELLRGESGFGQIVYGAVGLVIFLIIVGNVVMPTIVDANQTTDMENCGTYLNETCTWSDINAGAVSMWDILPIVVIASVILFVIGKR